MLNNQIKYLFYIASNLFIQFEISPLKIQVLTYLMLLDIITGVLMSYFNSGGASVKSKVFYAGICGKLLVILLPIVVQLCGKGIGVDLSFLTNSLFNCLFVVESYSIISNIQSIREGKNLKEYDALSIVIRELQGIFLKFFEITRTNFKNEIKISTDKSKKEE